MKPHPHAETIIAWANGEKVEYFDRDTGEWFDCKDPSWYETETYRVKPAEPERS